MFRVPTPLHFPASINSDNFFYHDYHDYHDYQVVRVRATSWRH